MATLNEQLHHLADRVRAGDAQAGAKLQAELGPQLDRIVRRALRSSARSSNLTRQIRQAADCQPDSRLSSPHRPPSAQISHVSRHLTAKLLDGLEPFERMPRAMETVADF